MGHLGIILYTDPFNSQNSTTVLKLIKSALKKGHSVSLFLMDNGIYNACPNLEFTKEKINIPDELSKLNINLVTCGQNVKERGFEEKDLIKNAKYGDMYDLSNIVKEVDRLICFV
ncbi:MAG: DsrE/DsrF/TusD sulfur relay family protein [Candidatus Hydrothermarchaeota archaeon]